MYKMQKLTTDKTGKQTMIYIEGPDANYVMDLYHEANVVMEDIEEEQEELECPHCGSEDIAQDSEESSNFHCLDCKKPFHG